jgi:hypothetical protein
MPGDHTVDNVLVGRKEWSNMAEEPIKLFAKMAERYPNPRMQIEFIEQ